MYLLPQPKQSQFNYSRNITFDIEPIYTTGVGQGRNSIIRGI